MAPDTQNIQDELAAALSIENEDFRVEALLDLAPRLPPESLNKVLEAVPSIQDHATRALALAGIAPYLDDGQVQQAIGAASHIATEAARSHAWGALGARLPEEARARFISVIQESTRDPKDRLKAWIQLAPYLTSDLKQEAISTALTLGYENERSEALIALAPHLPDVWKLKALESARNISLPFLKVQTIASLIPALPKKERAAALNEVLGLSRELQSPYDQAVALLTLRPQMPESLKTDLFSETFHIADSIPNPQQRVEILVRLAETMPLREALIFFTEFALGNLEQLDDDKVRGDVLTTLARLGPPELHLGILEAAQQIKDPKVKSNVVIQLQGILEQTPALPHRSGEEHVTGQAIQDFPDPAPEPDPEDEIDRATVFEQFGDSDAATPPPDSEAENRPIPKPRKAKAPRKKPATIEAPVIEEPESPSPDESVGVKAYLHSDRWTLDDQLNYSLYADAIAEFIFHNDTKPPLAIGVLAPWGQGKTTLMKMIQNQIETKAKGTKVPTPPGVVAPPITPGLHFRDLRSWLQDPTNYRLGVEKLNYPTVWFNAWKYQNSEQLWAGMAYSILSQLVGQLDSPVERERFWLALQAERIDFNAIRRDIHRMVFERVAPWIVTWALIGVVGLMVALFAIMAGNVFLGSGGGVALLLSAVMSARQWKSAVAKVDTKPLEGKFTQYVRQPTYEGKLGFFHEIEMDVQRVFRLLVAEGKPVVVFIDDLDRCSPGTVAQVIEAMNLFLSADFPDCYFVVGMDAQVVAASMEVAYENLDKKLKGVTRSYGSLGWYFMDKFIQLQFNIPNMTPDQRSTYLTNLFGREKEKNEKLPAAELDNVEKQLEENLNSNALRPEQLPEQAMELAKLRLQRPLAWQRLSHTLIKTSAQQLSDDNPTLQKYLERYEPFLGVSPRGIKRFANLYRFYSLSQLSRQSQGLPACSPGALARWLVIMLRWPQVVRWIQWESEAKLSAGTGALHKAEALEAQLVKTASHAAWLKYLAKMDPNHAEWMGDKQFYEFLKTPARSDEKLSFAVQTGVW
ncbi:MAG TPA: P-loop NTPase fold protein [Pyrinomonadaceae bacterium]|nr:P-loop NTPase fold protein [Pyrinomonadaceae bacterium]